MFQVVAGEAANTVELCDECTTILQKGKKRLSNGTVTLCENCVIGFYHKLLTAREKDPERNCYCCNGSGEDMLDWYATIACRCTEIEEDGDI